MAYRYWCGECGFKTPWLTESEGRERQIEHYTRRHPGIPPGGQVESSAKSPDGMSCAQVVGIFLLLLFLLAVFSR
ncbi:hypothetical protein [Embleya hyalina]|uniref:Uncharacterized protein n=1 Tax=Embleya hyalina TaxID=516124 RepID=A0A401Z2C9_9ACTN|nr:hypothetical protein [Embleya hyalina]GCE01002.1 hypothetical protein EHYA_08741 [Embleya hyalina]